MALQFNAMNPLLEEPSTAKAASCTQKSSE